MHALIVEDDLALQGVLVALFEQEGWTCARAGNGGRALDHLGIEEVDVVVTDLMMAGTDGFHLLDGMQTRGLRLPVYVFSAAPPSQLDRARSHPLAPRVIPKSRGALALLEAVSGATA